MPELSSKPSKRRVAIVATLMLVLFWAASGVLAAFAFTRRRADPFPEPAPSGLTDVRLRTSDGLRIGAWWSERSNGRASVVLVHGNGGSREEVEPNARAFREAGCSTLSISVRAHGNSEGDRNDMGFGARRDVIAAVRWLEERAPSRPVVVYGASLGAAATVFAASELRDRVNGYILVAPYAMIEHLPAMPKRSPLQRPMFGSSSLLAPTMKT